MTKKHSRYASHYGIEESQIPLFSPMYYANGFNHDELPVITGDLPDRVQAITWGLIPSFTNPEKYPIPKVQSQGLNARDDSLLTSFKWKSVVASKRCIVILDGFYEYHHVPGEKYTVPYHISSSHEPTLSIAGIWDRWVDKNDPDIVRETVCLITTDGNDKMAEIHNNPALAKRGSGPRMPAILDEGGRKLWLSENDNIKELVQEVIKPYPVDGLEYYTVFSLDERVKGGSGNTEKAIEPYDWPIIGLP